MGLSPPAGSDFRHQVLELKAGCVGVGPEWLLFRGPQGGQAAEAEGVASRPPLDADIHPQRRSGGEGLGQSLPTPSAPEEEERRERPEQRRGLGRETALPSPLPMEGTYLHSPRVDPLPGRGTCLPVGRGQGCGKRWAEALGSSQDQRKGCPLVWLPQTWPKGITAGHRGAEALGPGADCPAVLSGGWEGASPALLNAAQPWGHGAGGGLDALESRGAPHLGQEAWEPQEDRAQEWGPHPG